MSYLRNHKLLLLTIGVLLVANMALIWFYVLNKKDQRRDMGKKPADREDARTRLIKEVGFTPVQNAVYDSLRTQHYSGIRPMFGELRNTRDSLYKLIHRTEISDSVISALSASVCRQQEIIDLKIHNYFRSLRDLCTDEQKVKMDSFLVNLSKQMPWGGGRRGPGGSPRSKK